MLAAVALALPPFLATNCWMDLLGWDGRWRSWLPFDIYSLGGTVWVLSMLLWPIAAFLTLAAWQRVQAAQLDVEPALTGGSFVRWLLWPMARAAVGQSAVLTFVLALNNFAVPALLQVKVFPAEVWVSFNTNLNSAQAFVTSWPLIVAPLILLFLLRSRSIAWPHLEGTLAARTFRRQLGRGWFGSAGFLTGGAVIFSVGLPLGGLAADARTWNEMFAAAKAGQTAILNSAMLAAGAATLIVMIGLLTWRWRMGTAVWLPFLIPGVLIGILLILAFNRPGLSAVYQSAGIVLLAWTIRYLAIGWNGAAQAMRSVDRDLTDAARLEGASVWQLFRHACWPQVSPLLAAAWFVTYLLCLWDVETLVLIVPPGGETLALRIFNFLHYGHNAQVNALCLWLLALALAPLLIFVAAGHLSRGTGVRRLLSQNPKSEIPNPKSGGAALRRWVPALLFAAWFGNGCSPRSEGDSLIQSQLFDRVQVIGSRGAGLGQFNKPRSLAVDAQDNLYVVDMTGRVQKFSPDGNFLSYWQMEQTDKGKPKGMCRDAKGNIIVIEPHYSRVNHFTPEGKGVAQWGTHGTNAGQLAFPRAAAVTSRGDVWVSEYGITERVQRFDGEGARLVGVIGRAGAGSGEFNRPEGLCVDANDRLYVADSCNHRIQVFSPAGEYLRAHGTAGAGRGELSYPYDIRVDPAGRQYVCEFGNSRIQIFDVNDQPLETLGGAGAAPGLFSNPWSIALDSKGNLYVADSMNHRVQKFVRKQEAARLEHPAVNRKS